MEYKILKYCNWTRKLACCLSFSSLELLLILSLDWFQANDHSQIVSSQPRARNKSHPKVWNKLYVFSVLHPSPQLRNMVALGLAAAALMCEIPEVFCINWIKYNYISVPYSSSIFKFLLKNKAKNDQNYFSQTTERFLPTTCSTAWEHHPFLRSWITTVITDQGGNVWKPLKQFGLLLFPEGTETLGWHHSIPGTPQTSSLLQQRSGCRFLQRKTKRTCVYY